MPFDGGDCCSTGCCANAAPANASEQPISKLVSFFIIIIFSRWTFAIYSGLSCDFAQPRAREPLRSLRGIDRLRVFRAIAPIRFPRWTDDDWLFVAAEGVDEVRSRIMPVNRKYPLKVLLEACDYYVAKTRRMTFEYILIAGVNDTDEQACELAKIARRLSAKINLISYNTVEGLEWSRPSHARRENFNRSCDIAAACGHLRLQTKLSARL